MYFTEADVKKCIINLKFKKSSGVYELKNESSKVLLPLWTLLFNHILDTGSILSSWQVGKIVPIYKKVYTNESSYYRAITITNFFFHK